MKLQQLKYLKAIKDNNLNVSAASQSLFTTQPGVSKQVGLLEKELGVRIFERRGKNLSGVTPIGERILEQVERMLALEQKIKALANEHLDPSVGTLNIYTTHTIARYLLPNSVSYFTQKYPNINFHLQPTLPLQTKGVISKGHSDFSIVAHDIGADNDLIVLPAYLWTLGLVVPDSHPLADVKMPTLKQLAEYPILSYEPGSTGRQTQDEAFARVGISPNYFMTVMDADVIKRYVQLGFGIGIISTLAARDIENSGLTYINLDHLFAPSNAWICFSKDILLQNYMYDFLTSFSPHLTKTLMENVLMQNSSDKVDKLFDGLELPVY
ncbi:LysR substrate-binding domain-containing protein [Enterovibrio norvegicus]|uniref:LysR substrate-binding domain-containing protein n=2 Tax=Enterovibrio norvegicus TaxID=188144 RepID=A0A2N7L9E7_9GAMM|nr:LysR substrate-binding domain-containing protein [Enterovibrio norvegicus]MCC4796508.1 LysR family transcriptional regulator [Enterovibrio norvegicus]OEE63110.1 transcriptional regulator [Enterovibrio norvegicus]OEF52354.1 transcriptional regulator [Enterovibrio norvegicus]OEF55327.1 transcriptional regulator [Enterovibrio norvegicus]PMH64307.1 transcriptional regulator [Enterovibrio norvegicus]